MLGNLCVVGREERAFSADDVAMLRALAAEAVRRIQQRRTTEAFPCFGEMMKDEGRRA